MSLLLALQGTAAGILALSLGYHEVPAPPDFEESAWSQVIEDAAAPDLTQIPAPAITEPVEAEDTEDSQFQQLPVAEIVTPAAAPDDILLPAVTEPDDPDEPPPNEYSPTPPDDPVVAADVVFPAVTTDLPDADPIDVYGSRLYVNAAPAEEPSVLGLDFGDESILDAEPTLDSEVGQAYEDAAAPDLTQIPLPAVLDQDDEEPLADSLTAYQFEDAAIAAVDDILLPLVTEPADAEDVEDSQFEALPDAEIRDPVLDLTFIPGWQDDFLADYEALAAEQVADMIAGTVADPYGQVDPPPVAGPAEGDWWPLRAKRRGRR